MASELFAEGGNKLFIKITPGVAGMLRVYADGEIIFDKKAEDGQFPTLPRVKQMRAAIRERLDAKASAPA